MSTAKVSEIPCVDGINNWASARVEPVVSRRKRASLRPVFGGNETVSRKRSRRAGTVVNITVNVVHN
jgi:hypothetical protein